MTRLPRLDALRGVLAAVVVAAHMPWDGAEYLPSREAVIGFFGLSGYLLGGRSELEVPWRFTWRRERRIWPEMAAATVATTAICGSWWALPWLLLHGWPVLALGGHRPDGVGHLWSLAAEGWWYALLPWLSRRQLAWLVVAGPALRLAAAWHPYPEHQHAPWAYVDALAMGALVSRHLADGWRPRRTTAALLVVLAVAVRVLWWRMAGGPWWPDLVGRVCWALSSWTTAAGAVALVHLLARGWPGTPSRIGRWLGDTSYGVYLWHPLWIAVLHPAGIVAIPVVWALSAATTLAWARRARR